VKGQECVEGESDYWSLKSVLDQASPSSEEWQDALRDAIKLAKGSSSESAAMRRAIEERTGCRISVVDTLPSLPVAAPAPHHRDNVIQLTVKHFTAKER
jgi:hypothetical protein